MNQLQLHRSPDQWREIFTKTTAIWLHNGQAERDHALLTSGNHSDGFMNSEMFMEHPMLLDEAAADLVGMLFREGLVPQRVDRVVGPALGAITIAHDVARNMERESGHRVPRSYAEQHEQEHSEGFKRRWMSFDRTRVLTGESVLLVEDVITTGGSVKRAMDAVVEEGGTVLPYVTALVNRSGLDEVHGLKIVSLTDFHPNQWPPNECPLCGMGSKAVKPKPIWGEFTKP
jgi:orotate phosphoribosyltransferase